jgi:hypothetical protein
MPRTSRRIVVSAVVLALTVALATPPAQARESATYLDTLTAKVGAWVTALWPWSAVRTEGSGGADPNGRSKRLNREAAGLARASFNANRGRVVSRPVQTLDCVNGTSDPNGCPH